MDISRLFIISGPSGAGEDSVINGLSKKMKIHKAITTTTRAPRDGEVDGVDYYFVSKEQFEKALAENKMAEWAQHYNDNYYGVTREELNRIQQDDAIGIWKIDYKGVIHAKKMFPGIIAIFLMAESLAVLEKRIRERSGVSEDYVAKRMAYTKEWLEHIDIYDYTVINKDGHLQDTIDDVARIITHHIESSKKHPKHPPNP